MTTTEVGTAYVTIIPSAKGFARRLQKDIAKEFAKSDFEKLVKDQLEAVRIQVPVEPVVDDPRGFVRELRTSVDRATRAVHAHIDTQVDRSRVAEQLGAAVDLADDTVTARVPVDVDADGLARRLRASVAASTRGVGVRVPVDADSLTVDVGRAIARVRVEADSDRTGRRIGETLAAGAASTLGPALNEGIATPMRSVATNPIMSSVGTLIGATLGAFAAPAIGAAISAALIGGTGIGIIGLGALVLREEPQLVAAAKSLTDKLKATLTQAAQPLIGPFVEAMGKLEQMFTDIAPDLRDIFDAIAPAIVPLTEGVIGFIKGVLPGVLDMAEAAVPMFKDLASTLPRLGEDIGAFLGLIADQGPEASQFFRDLLNLIGLTLIAVGGVVAFLTHVYGFLREKIDGALEVLRQASLGLGYIVEDVIGFFRRLRDFIAGVWKAVRGEADGAIKYIRDIPGRIRSALGNTGSLLYNAGRSIIQGLINGLKSMFGPLGDAAGKAAGLIKEYFPFSPAKRGPLSGRGNPYYSGQSIVELLASGVTSTLGTAKAAASDLAGTFALGGSPVLAAPPVGGYGLPAATTAPVPLVAEWVGGDGDPIVQALRDHVRIYYSGSAQAALGS